MIFSIQVFRPDNYAHERREIPTLSDSVPYPSQNLKTPNVNFKQTNTKDRLYLVHDQYIRQLLKKILFFRMGKKKRKQQQQRLPDKDVSKQESQESATKFSNPTSQGAHSDIPQSSVSQTKEASSQETLMKPMSDMKLSELPVQKDVQKYPEHSSGAKPKTLVFSGGKQKDEKDSLKKAKQKDDSSNIYTVLSTKDKVGKKGRKIQLRANHFPMEINVPGGLIYHYDVKFIIPDKKEVKKSDRKLLLETIQRLKENYQKIFHNAVVAFDGLKYAYTCEKLHFSSDEFEGEVEIKEHTTNLKRPEVKVILKKTGSSKCQGCY